MVSRSATFAATPIDLISGGGSPRRNERRKEHGAEDGAGRPVAEGRGRTQTIPQLATDDARKKGRQSDGRAVQSDTRRAKLRWDEVDRERLAHRAEGALVYAVQREERRERPCAGRDRETGIRDDEEPERAEQQSLAAPPIREPAGRIRGEGRDEVIAGVNEERLLGWNTDVGRLQDDERLA